MTETYLFMPTDLHKQQSQRIQRIINKLVDLESRYPGCIHPEFFDWLDIVENGLIKYKMNSWLEIDAPACTHKHNHNSMFHHLAESFTGVRADKESGHHPLLHLVCRGVFGYIRDIKGVTDKEHEIKKP